MRKLSSKKSIFSGIVATRALGAPAHAMQCLASVDVPPVHPKVNQFTVSLARRNVAAKLGASFSIDTDNWPSGATPVLQIDGILRGGNGNLTNGGAGCAARYAVRKTGTSCTASGAGTITGAVG